MSDFNNLTEADHQTTKALWHEAKGTVRLQAMRIREIEADKADLVRVLGVADERIKALEALNSRLANDINCGELLPQTETPSFKREAPHCPSCSCGSELETFGVKP